MKTIAAILMMLLACSLPAGEGPWANLFDGKTFAGWEQKNGKAKFEIVDGAIVGTTVKGTPNSFLCTEKEYANFILELEFKVDPELNSGVQIRSRTYPEETTTTIDRVGQTRERTFPKGRVYGYQVEIDPSDRAWCGGIYHEAGRGWLYPLDKNDISPKAFKPNEWNHFHIEAIGDRIRTWLNGVPVANLVDSSGEKSGFIALQVHQSKEDGHQVMWRNIRIIDLGEDRNEFPPVIEK